MSAVSSFPPSDKCTVTDVTVIMLYGVRPRGDRDLTAYFQYAFRHPNMQRTPDAPLFLGGGATDPSQPTLTEAECAFGTLLDLMLDVRPRTTHVCPKGIDSREVLAAINRRIMRTYSSSPPNVTICCAWTHVDVVRVHAKKIFGERARVVGISFPHDMSDLANGMGRLARVPRALLAWAGWHSDTVRAYELKLRYRHMRKCAKYPDKLPPE